MLLDRLMPRFDFAERHATVVRATPERVYASLRTIEFGTNPIVRFLLKLRGMKGGMRLPPNGFVVLAEDAPREVVIGLEGPFWQPACRLREVTPESFTQPLEGNTARGGWNFFLEAEGEKTRVTTETRVLCTDTSRRKFRAYWMLIRPFSGIIRRMMLRTIRKAVERPLMLLLAAVLTTSAFAQSADLLVGGTYSRPTSKRGVVLYSGVASSLGPDAATNVILEVTLPPHTHVQRAEFYPGDWTCTEGGGQVTCTIASLPGKDAYNSFSLELRRDDDAGGFDPVTFSIRSDTPDPNLANNSERRDTWWRRRFHVTTSADAGPGSLRQAILDMNAQCTGAIGCEVFFDLPLPATIEPLTPLPAITGCSIVLDADADDIVDPLEEERRLMLSGRRLASGNGLDLRPACEAEVPESTLFVAGLAIGDFPWNGIYVAPAIANTTTFLSRVFAGTDMTGLLARPNAARGINIDSPLAYVDVTHAIVSGNHRSGIVVNDSRYASIWSTRIGIARDGSPLPNGASGVYAARGHVYVDGSSHIAHNAHFGAALQRGVQGMIAANYVHSNGGAPIDYGLDGPTPNDAVLPAKPELHDAYYDAATNETVVRLTPPNKTTITIFASRHRADLERPVFFTHLGYPQKPDMEVRIQGDLRGEILTAVAYHYVWGDEPHWLWRSSEASEGVAVR